MSKAGSKSKKKSEAAGKRILRLREVMNLSKLDCLLITGMENIRYMTGFTGSAGSAVVTQSSAHFLTDGRYVTQAGMQVQRFKIKQYTAPIGDVAELINSLLPDRLGVEAEHMTHAFFNKLKNALRVPMVRSTAGLVEKLRIIKDNDEVAALQGAADIVNDSFEDVMGAIRPGRTEWEVAVELEHRFKLSGSEKNSFDFIVASGKRGALPHGLATDKKIRRGEMVTIDCGCRWKGYYSDCTRTCVVGKATARQREIYQVVLDAQLKAVDAVRPGVKACQVDAAAREHIAAKGYGKYFSHSAGHGVGLAVHEEPRISHADKRVLELGMVLTVEPGIYIPDWGGVRIEDMVLVTDEGGWVLTSGVSKELLIV